MEHVAEKARSPIQTTQNLIFYGPPGTGKTYQIAHELIPQFMDEKEKRYEFVTFHQSYSYEEFVEGIRPVMGETEDNKDNICYEIKRGIFKQIALRATKQPDKAYAIFIDEINRGNISKIFGELITLIELDKRIKPDGSGLKIRLPYSQEEFGVPVNLSIIGAMNTADRSIAFIDTALRRRFAFVEMMPDAELIRKTIGGDLGSMVADLLTNINDRIEFLYDRDHRIGHSYFLNIKNYLDLKTVFLRHVIPLLQEYFYGDWGKICLVLGCPYSEDGTPYKEDAEPVINAFEMIKMDIIGFEHDVLENKLRYEICPEFINATENGVVRYFVDMIGK
ncbi:MAG: AAA family ATPase [Desulfosalsimonadaceae bacterium]